MRKVAPLALLLFLSMNSMLFAGLCTTGRHVGNPHCQSHTSDSGRAPSGTTTGIGSTGVTPDTSPTNPHTGTITPDHHNAYLVPPQPIPTPIPTPTPVPHPVPHPTPGAIPQMVPSQVVTGTYAPGPSGYAPVPPQPIPTPMPTPTPVPHPVPHPTPGAIPQLVPSQVVTGTYAKGPSGYAAVPHQPIPTPTATPTPVPHPVPHPTPGAIPQLVPSQVVTGTVSPGATSQALLPKTQPTQYIGVVSKGTQMPVTSGRHIVQTSYGFNVIEPGIQNKKVAVYRSNDAREMLYKDTITMDNTGFLLIDLGIRDPDYIK